MPYLLILLLSLTIFTSNAQKRSAKKLFAQAQECRDREEAENLYRDALLKDPTYLEAYLTIDGILTAQNRYSESIDLWRKANTHIKEQKNLILIKLSKSAYLDGQYQLADSCVQQVPSQENPTLKHLQACIAFALDATTHPQVFNAINLGTKLNTPYDDYWPSLSLDEKRITTTVLLPANNKLNHPQEDLYTSTFQNGEWQSSKPIDRQINSDKNEGAQCVSADGTILLFTACDRRTGIGSCDIFWSRKVQDRWTTPEPLPEPINSYYWDAHPSLSADNKKLYFSSNRNGGCGGKDLYVANVEFSHECHIKSLYHLGHTINTKEDEISPFIHPDNKTLYFSSDGHVGMGKQDIYYTKINELFNNEVINMGYPINTQHDEIGLVLNTQGNTAYFATERLNSRKKDIYRFETPEEARPEKVKYLRVSSIDANTQSPLQSLIQISLEGDHITITNTKNTAELYTTVKYDEVYCLNISRPHYFTYTDTLVFDQLENKPVEKIIALRPIKSGEHVIIKNILFDYDSYDIDEKYAPELDRIYLFICENTDQSFEIQGHTDDRGSNAYNLKLSTERALAVYNYLISKGIPTTQLSYKGCGNSTPISENAKKNRRIELHIK